MEWTGRPGLGDNTCVVAENTQQVLLEQHFFGQLEKGDALSYWMFVGGLPALDGAENVRPVWCLLSL